MSVEVPICVEDQADLSTCFLCITKMYGQFLLGSVCYSNLKAQAATCTLKILCRFVCVGTMYWRSFVMIPQFIFSFNI